MNLTKLNRLAARTVINSAISFVVALSAPAALAQTNDSQNQTLVGKALVRSTTVSIRDYNAFLLTDPSAVSIVERLKTGTVEENLAENLRTQFAKAQISFLQAEQTQMRDDWLGVVSFAFKADWTSSYREMIVIGFMRLAQVAVDSTETKKWLELAAQFDLRFNPDASLFPPPLIEQYRHIKKSAPQLRVSVAALSDFETALINGVPVQLEGVRNLDLPDQTIRLTLLSSAYQPISRVLHARDIAKFRPHPSPWVSGSCGTAVWNETDLHKNINLAALFANSCVAIRGVQKPLLPLADLSHRSNIGGGTGHANWDPPGISNSTVSDSDEKPFYKKGWFWVGVAAAAGAAIYISQKNNAGSSSDNKPTSTVGF